MPAPPGAPLPTTDAEEVEQIVVTARRKGESVQDVPLSVTPFTKAQLEQSSIRDLTDLEALAPNVIIDPITVVPGGAGLSIRGINFNDLEKSFDPSVGVFIDGIYIGTSATQLLNNFDLESVEILRGPQGTLFGRNTTGGIINVRRTRPTGQLGLKASATVASFGRHDYKLVANAPLMEDKLAVKISGYSFNSDGYFHNTTTDEYSPQTRYLSGALDLLYTPTKSLEILAKYEHIRDRGTPTQYKNASDSSHILCFGPPLGLTSFPDAQCSDPKSNKYDVQGNFDVRSDLDLDAVTLNMEQRLGDDYKLVSISGWRGHDEDVGQDFDGSPADFFSTRRTQRFDQVSEELRLHAQPVENVEVVAGLYYYYGHYDINATVHYLFDQPFIHMSIGAPLPPGTVRIQDAGQTTHSIAGFAHGEWEFVDNFRATLAGRYTLEKKKFNNHFGLSNSLNPDIAQIFVSTDMTPAIHASESWARFTPAAGLDYKLTESVLGAGNGALTYFTYSRGFKSGGFNGRADPASTKTFAPEDVDQFELGLKTDWFKRRVTFNTAAFWINYGNKQEETLQPSMTGGNQTLTDNAADAVIKGLEFEASAMPLRGHNGLVGGLRLFANLGLLDAKYTKFNADLDGPDMAGNLVPQDYKDLELRNAPAWQFGAGVANPYELSFGRVVLNAQYRHRAETRTGISLTAGTGEPNRQGISPSLGTFDASVTLEADELVGGAWRLTVFGRNIANKTTRAVYINLPGLLAFETETPPTMWGAELAATY